MPNYPIIIPAPVQLRVESLGQLNSRLISRRYAKLVEARLLQIPLLPPELFVDSSNDATVLPLQMHNGDIVEITGDVNAGKTHMLMEMIVRAVLPARGKGDDYCSNILGGNNLTRVLLIDTEHQMQISKLSAMLEKHIALEYGEDLLAADKPQWLEHWADRCLERVHLLKCHTAEQLELAIVELDDYMRAEACKDTPVVLLALDSVATFYWLEEYVPARSTEASSIGLPVRMETYMRRLVGRLHQIAKDYGAVLAYVRPEGFAGQRSELRTQKVDYTVTMRHRNSDQQHVDETSGAASVPPSSFCAKVAVRETPGVFICGYTIDDFGIRWESKDNKKDIP